MSGGNKKTKRRTQSKSLTKALVNTDNVVESFKKDAVEIQATQVSETHLTDMPKDPSQCELKGQCNNCHDCDVFNKCNHYSVSEYRKRFVKVVALFTVILVILSILSYIGFRDSQKAIVQFQKQHLEQTADIFDNIYNRINKKPFNQDSLIKQLTMDSILVNNLTKYDEIKDIIVGLANNLSHKDFAVELRKDSLLIKQEISNMQNSTTEMLELQFNRIQHEYTILALWAGILMIVFLVFSFYSLHKTDDMIKQGRDGIKELRELSVRADNILASVQTEKKKIFENINGDLSLLKKEVGESKSKNTEAADTFKAEIDVFRKHLEEFNTNIEASKKLVQKQEGASNHIQQLISDYMDELNAIKSQIEKVSTQTTKESNNG